MYVHDRVLVLGEEYFRNVIVDAIREAERHGLIEVEKGEGPIAIQVVGRDNLGDAHEIWSGPVEIQIIFPPVPVTYGFTVSWRDWPWSKVNRAGLIKAATPLEARIKAQELAISFGWTPRRWWQFWRWNEVV